MIRQRNPFRRVRYLCMWEYNPKTKRTFMVFQTIDPDNREVLEHEVREVRGPILGRSNALVYGPT